MNTHPFVAVLLVASLAHAQPATPDATPVNADHPPAALAGGKTEMEKWLEATDAQWQAVFKREVTDGHDAQLNQAKLQYLAALEEGIKKASAAGDLDGAVVLRNEQKRFADTQVFPATDEEGDGMVLKAIRAAVRVLLAKAERESSVRAKALFAKYDQVLAKGQVQLTKQGRLDDAMLLKKKRDEVAAAWVPAASAKSGDEADAAAKGNGQPPENAKPLAAFLEIAGRNLLTNANFEHGTDGWDIATFGKSGTMKVDKKELHNGKPTLRIDNTEGGLSFVKQVVVGKPETHYQLSGYIMTKNVEPEKQGRDWGACLMVGFTAEVRVGQSQSKVRGGKSASIQKTKQWTKITVDFTSGPKTELPVGAAMGYYNENVLGTAWFSELSLVELGDHAKK